MSRRYGKWCLCGFAKFPPNQQNQNKKAKATEMKRKQNINFNACKRSTNQSSPNNMKSRNLSVVEIIISSIKNEKEMYLSMGKDSNLGK
jgi:hypothetical protein